MFACLRSLILIVDIFVSLILKAYIHAADFIVQFIVIKI